MAVGCWPKNCRRLCDEAGFAAGLVEVVGGLSRSRSQGRASFRALFGWSDAEEDAEKDAEEAG